MTADASQDRPAVPEGAVHDAEIRAALEGAGVDLTGMARGPAGNSRVANPAVDGSALAHAVSLTGISDDRMPRAVPRSAGGDASKDGDLAERFAAWQQAQKAQNAGRDQIKKAEAALGALQGDLERGQRKAEKKARRKAERERDPHLREAFAKKKSLRAMRKHLNRGHSVTATLEHGFATYRSKGGRLAFNGFKNDLQGK